MAEYIKREALLSSWNNALKNMEPEEDGTHAVSFETVLFYVEHFPGADVVEVVRCRDCKHWKPTGSEAGSCFEDMEPIGGCRWVNFCRKASDFCSYGERKDGD